MKVFLSHTHHHSEAATAIGSALELLGHEVLRMDNWHSGRFPEKMRQAIAESDFMLALWSPHYFASDYCKQEWDAALVRNTTRTPGCLLAVKVEKMSPGDMEASWICWNASGSDEPEDYCNEVRNRFPVVAAEREVAVTASASSIEAIQAELARLSQAAAAVNDEEDRNLLAKSVEKFALGFKRNPSGQAVEDPLDWLALFKAG